MPDPRPSAGGSLLLRRSEPRRPAGPHRTAAPPRAEDEVQGPEDLARPLRGVRVRGRRLRGGARARLVGAAPEGAGPRRSRQPRPRPDRARHAGFGGGGAAAPRREAARAARPVGLWWHGGPEAEAPNLGLLRRAYARRFDLEHTFRFLKQTLGWTTPRVRHPEQADHWTWLILAAFTQLRLARPSLRGRPTTAVGAPLRPGPPDTGSGPPRRFDAFGADGHARQAAETLRTLARKAQGEALGPGEALSGCQEGRLNPRRRRGEEFCDGYKAHRKTPHG